MKQKMKILKSIIVLLLLGGSAYSQENTLKSIPYFFDTGSEQSITADAAIKITEASMYADNNSYGLIGNNYSSFVNENFKQEIVRDKFTYDGISGKEIEFRIDIPRGEWYFTFWVETRFESIPTTELFINGKKHDIVWHELKPGAEASHTIIENYRVVHTKVIVEDEGLTFRLAGKSDLIQLLGFSFCPEPEIKTDLHKKFYRVIKEAGKYKSKVQLNDLALALKNNSIEYPEDSFLFYWAQQVSLLAEAKRNLDTEGWEWARQLTGHSIFDRMHQVLLLLDAQIENFDTTAYPLLERSLWYRGKLCFDLELERGGDYQLKIAKQDLSKLYRLYPNDDALAMLNGERVDKKEYCDNLPKIEGAPLWSTLQREAICRLQSEINWWVNKRQAPNGELGGKIGDDVEILRWWSTFLLLGDETTIEGWTKLAKAVWNDPKVYKGFSKRILDVEHSSEFISDSTPELILIDNDKAKEILDYTAKYFRDLWSNKNKEGRRYFKSSWYSSTEVDETPPKNRDVGYNTRTIKPLRYLAWFTRDPKYIELLNEWADGWLYVTMKTDKNKPKGIVPPSVRYTDESINGDEPNWYEANMYWTYFDWTHDAGSRILDQLLFTYTLTGRKELLEPVKLSLELISEYKDEINSEEEFEKGSEEWAAYHLSNQSGFWEVVQNWRMITGDDTYDNLILKYGKPYTKYCLTGNSDYLINALNFLLSNVRYNVGMRTNLVLHTDRVYVRGNEILKAMITGNGSSGVSPYYEVTWEGADKDLTILVDQSGSHMLSIQLFSYLDEAQKVTARPWRLEPGKYKLTINGTNFSHDETIVINKPGQKVQVSVPSKKLVNVKITQIME